MTAQPDADERRIRNLLVRRGVGPDASTPSAQAPEREPSAASSSDAWWDELYADEAQPAEATPQRRSSPRMPDWWADKPEQPASAAPAVEDPEPQDDEPDLPAAAPAAKAEEPRPAAPSGPRIAAPQSLLDAWDNTSARLRWLIYHGTSAGLGWGLGLVHWATHVTAWVAADRWTDPQSVACYALALGSVALYRRTRGWWWPVTWMAAVPASSTVLGVLLYAPNS